ncbi:hypothetical protein KPH14_012966, partial [Odynerus spinipes]
MATSTYKHKENNSCSSCAQLAEEVKELRHMFTEFLKSSWTKDSNNNGHYQNQTRRPRSRSTTPNRSGSAVSVLSKKYIQSNTQATDCKLYAANNTVIKTYGKKYMEIDFDLAKAYHQIPMTEEDIPKTAIITPRLQDH